VLQERGLLIKDFNIYSTVWNPQTATQANIVLLENLIKSENLIVNNNSEVTIQLKNTSRKSIINLALTTLALEMLIRWCVNTEHPTLSDHVLIIVE
jgi:hypothetical protein